MATSTNTEKVLKRTVETTNAHVESDKSGEIEERWGDASIGYSAYVQYDEAEVPTIEPVDDDEKEDLRHTHLNMKSDISERISEMNEYYKEHKLGPYKYPIWGNNDNTVVK